MANECCFCGERHGETNMLVHGGETWIEFCKECGSKETLTNADTGEVITVQALFDRCKTGEPEQVKTS